MGRKPMKRRTKTLGLLVLTAASFLTTHTLREHFYSQNLREKEKIEPIVQQIKDNYPDEVHQRIKSNPDIASYNERVRKNIRNANLTAHVGYTLTLGIALATLMSFYCWRRYGEDEN